MPADAKSPSDWKSVPLPDATPGRRHNVTRLRAMGGDPTCVPPDFNRSMLAIWEELWHSMPRSGRVSVLVNSLLNSYKERCRAERKQPRDSTESPAALLPVSYAQDKDWMLKQQKHYLNPSRQVLWTRKHERLSPTSTVLWLSSQRQQLHSWSSLLIQPLQ